MDIKHSLLLSTCLLNPLMAEDKPEVNFTAHSNFTMGSSDINEALLPTHAHDPNDEFTVQGIEFTLDAKFNQYFGAKASYNFFLDEEDHIDGEWEDAYLRFNDLPGGFAIRAGRIFNETTSQNNHHLHYWNYVNSSLLTTRFNGEEGLLSESIELKWALPNLTSTFLSVSYGDAVEHSHEEEVGALPTEVHGEESYLASDIWTIALDGTLRYDDFHKFSYRLHHTEGTNGYGLDGQLSGIALSYLWRENGQEAGGRSWEIGAEYVERDFDYSSEDESVTGNETEDGFSIYSQYGFNEQWELGVRYETVNGSTIVEETPEIERFSAAITRRFSINDTFGGHARLQYDHDDRDETGTSDTFWLQFQFNFGKTL